jgi:hypothetical protein
VQQEGAENIRFLLWGVKNGSTAQVILIYLEKVVKFFYRNS